MDRQQKSKRSAKELIKWGLIFVGGAVLMTWIWLEVGEDNTPPSEADASLEAAKTIKINLGENAGKRPELPLGPQVPMKKLVKSARWNPPRPLIFLINYGTNTGEFRSKSEARRQVERAREKFLRGEDSFELIRDYSDPPVGIPRDVKQPYENLGPTEASPVINVKNGYVVFFGTPTSRPE